MNAIKPSAQTRNPNLDSNIRHQMGTAHPSLAPETLLKQDQILRDLRANWWTGLSPEKCPGFGDDKVLRSLPPPNQNTCTRAEVNAYFNNTWTLTELLFLSLKRAEAFFIPPYHNLRHPMVFYYVHVAAVYVNKFRVAGVLEKPVNGYFEQLFETGVDEMSWDDLSKNEMEWPSLDQCYAYRKQVYGIISKIIDEHPDLAPGHKPITMEHPLWALFLGFEHERIHIETSSVLMRELPIDLVERPEHFPPLHPSANASSHFPPRVGIDYPKSSLAKVAAGRVRIGKDRAWPTFGWDNEYGTKELEVPAFEAGTTLISNGEFWEFVSDGGYRDQSLWTKIGWEWRTYRNVKWPTFWVPDGPQGSFRFKLRTCFEVIDMPWNWPAAVNYHEAKAYAAWLARRDGKAYRLLTEAEHYRLRAETDREGELPSYERWYGGKNTKASLHFTTSNFDLRFGSESPVTEQAEKSGARFSDVFGNLWHWLEDDFHPLADFKVHPYYDDFSTPCYDGKHTMMAGGSFISTGDESSYYERFHFRPHFYQHAGFRLACGEPGSLEKLAGRIAVSQSETDPETAKRVLSEQLNLHYGSIEQGLPASLVNMPGGERMARFPVELAEHTIKWVEKLGLETNKAIEVGCSVGGGVFKLAEKFKTAIGTDLKLEFIRAALKLKETGEHSFSLIEEGEITIETLARVESPEARARTQFRQADASALPAEYAGFDAVVIPNAIDRVPSPKGVLSRLGGARGLVKDGGLLVIASPFDWNTRFTPKEVWLGGKLENGKAKWSVEGLKETLAEDFELLETTEVPLLIRETKRRYTLIETVITVWRRK